jgi:predicted nucleotidyltransferase
MQESRQELSEDVLSRMKSRLQIAFGERLQAVILYGSEARHEAAADSDVDLLVLLTGPVNHGEDSWTCIRALYPLVLELERPIHAKPTDVLAYEAQEMPLYQNVRQEGILV